MMAKTRSGRARTGLRVACMRQILTDLLQFEPGRVGAGKRGKSRGGQGERALARMIWGSGGMTWLPGTANRAPR
jgi:hypothetical protein